MHERKQLIARLADGFIALPGGAGTLEEICEQWTWSQLGIHSKPCGFLNVNGYFDALFKMIEDMVGERFMAPEPASMLAVETDPDMLLTRFRGHQPPPVNACLKAARRSNRDAINRTLPLHSLRFESRRQSLLIKRVVS